MKNAARQNNAHNDATSPNRNVIVRGGEVYRALASDPVAEGDRCLTTIRQSDMAKIKDWRNEQIDILRQSKPLTDEEQSQYFSQVIRPSFIKKQPDQMLFSYLLNGRLIGYGGLVYLNWDYRRAEVSFLLETQRSEQPETHSEDFRVFIRLLKKIAFAQLKLHRLYTETFDIRPLHIRLLEECGFAPEGRMKQHVLIGSNYVDSLIHGCLRSNE